MQVYIGFMKKKMPDFFSLQIYFTKKKKKRENKKESSLVVYLL